MRKLGSINCVEVPSSPPNDGADHEPHVAFIFHGFGADAYDLQTLSDVLKTPWPTDYLFPQGPTEVPIGPGWTGRAWWQIDMAGIQAAAARGEHRDMANEYPEGLNKIRPRIMEMIEKAKVPWSKVILGGFSQGAMLATDIFLNAPEAPAGLMIFSGALICQDQWKALAPNRKGSTFFQSHGKSDAVLSFKGAQQLETILTQAGLKGRLQAFSGGHEIPLQTLSAASSYLSALPK